METEEKIDAAQKEIDAAVDAIIAKAEGDAANAPTEDSNGEAQIFDMKDMHDTGSGRDASRVKTREELLVRSIHEQLIYSTSYRLEDNCSKGNDEDIRTPYGPLVTHE